MTTPRSSIAIALASIAAVTVAGVVLARRASAAPLPPSTNLQSSGAPVIT